MLALSARRLGQTVSAKASALFLFISARYGKGNDMRRLTGWVTGLALLLASCGGGGGSGSGGGVGGAGGAGTPPPPPGTYTIGGTVSGLSGYDLVLQLVQQGWCTRGFCLVGNPLHIYSNGSFTFDSRFPGTIPNYMSVRLIQQPTSPDQQCVLRYAGIAAKAANETGIKVVCWKFAAVASAADNTVSLYAVDAASGALAAVSAPVGTGISPHAVAGTPDKRYLFVGNEGAGSVSAFGVDPASGALTAIPGSPFPSGSSPSALVLYKVFDTYLYVANAGSDTVSGYAVDTYSGSLIPLSTATFATGKGPSSIAVDPSRRFMYVANSGGSNDISAFSVDASSGLLAPLAGSPFPAGGNPSALAFGQAGKFLYEANPDPTSPSISGFSVDPVTGALSPLSGLPFAVPVSHGITADSSGAYLYVTNGAGIVAYAIDASTGALAAVPGFPVSTGANAYSVSIDSNDHFLYVTNDGAGTVAGFTLNDSTGALTPMPGSPFPVANRPDVLATF
jgi:6-phosphogluconolactonase (cycloisomerase 2 family)